MAASLQNNVLPDNVERWYSTATVRNSARILVPRPDKGEYLFPRSRQQLSEHPLVTRLGEEAVAYVLAQASYKYMYEIGLLETRFVIDCALDIINYKIGGASDDERREAITIVIDEGYHAYVALDFIIQMRAQTGIEPLEIPQTNGNLDAVHRAFAALPPQTHRAFQLLSVCLAEHTLTKDLLSIGREKETTRSFTQVMTDHVSDEGRHANYFAKLTTAYWANLDDSTRTHIGVMLPAYLDDYLAGDEQRVADRKVLSAAGLSADQVDMAIADTQSQYLASMTDYISKTKHNLVKLLQRMGVLNHAATLQAFRAHGVSI
jgi:hypothetical protein